MKYDTDKGTTHTYVGVYDEIFASLQNEPIHILEIGILSGGSLELWHEYFPKADIQGMDNFIQSRGFNGSDVNEQVVRDKFAYYPRITINRCNSLDYKDVDGMMQEKNFKFDIIVDDGDHRPESQVQTFKNLCPHWSGIMYVIEEVAGIDAGNRIVDELKAAFPGFSYELKVLDVSRVADDILVIIRGPQLIV